MNSDRDITLRDAIQQAISLGETDAAAIGAQVIARYGPEIVLSELDPAIYVAEIARRLIGSERRSSIKQLATHAEPKRDLMLKMVWLPGLRYVKIGEMTAEEWDRAAEVTEKASSTLSRYATYYRKNASVMRDQGVQFFREVRGKLPELPAAEELAA